MREWGSGGGTRRDFMVGCPLLAAAVMDCAVQLDRWIAPHLAVRAIFDYSRWSCSVTQPVRFLLCGLPFGCLLLIRVGGLSRLRFVGFGKSMMIVCKFMSQREAFLLDECLDAGDVSRAWSVWSHAAESALVDAYSLAGGPRPCHGFVLGRGVARFRRVRLGGCRIRKVRRNAVDVHDAADVFLYRDASIAPLLDMRRRIRAVMDVLGAMIRNGISLARSVELTCQWGRILAIGPLHPVTFGDFELVRGAGIGEFHRIISDLHRRLSDFIHEVVVHRRDEAVRGWRNWVREDPLIHPYKWLRPDLVPPSPFLQCDSHLTPGGSGVLADPSRIDEEFRKAWLPYFCLSGQRETSLEEFSFEVDGWLPLLPVVDLPRLTGQMLYDVVHRKSATAGSLDGWGWKELKVLPVSWFDQLARILTLVEDNGVWPAFGCLHYYDS